MTRRMTCPDGELNSPKCRTDKFGSPCSHLGEHDERDTCKRCSCVKPHGYCPKCEEVVESQDEQ
jgi:hypothetical protein